MIIFGLILMLVMIFMPQGLTRGLLDIYEQWKKLKQQTQTRPHQKEQTHSNGGTMEGGK